MDVSQQLRAGRNVLGVMLGNGWFAQESTNHGPRQLLVLLSVTLPGAHQPLYFRSATTAAAGSATSQALGAPMELLFNTTVGPGTRRLSPPISNL